MTEDEFDRVVDTYPYPIAGLFIRLGTVECLEPNFDRRLYYVLNVAEVTSRFISVLTLCCEEQLLGGTSERGQTNGLVVKSDRKQFND